MRILNLSFPDNSEAGLIRVVGPDFEGNTTGTLMCLDRQTKTEEKAGLLQTVFLNGKLIKVFSLAEIREKLNSY